MAGRIRTLKPELLEKARTARLRDDEWRLYVSLILLADDYGNVNGDPARIEAAVFWGNPSRGSQELLERLAEVQLVGLYSDRGESYVHIIGWKEHQKVDKPGKPRVPGPNRDDLRRFAGNSRDPRETLEKARETLAPDLRPPTSDHDRDQGENEDPAKPVEPTLFALEPLPPSEPPKPDRDEVVDQLLGELSAARKRVKPSSRALTPTEPNRSQIAARLRDGHTPDDVRHVIAVVEAECRAWKPGGQRQDPFAWFDAVSPFRPENFARKVARELPTARGSPAVDRPRIRDYREVLAEEKAAQQAALEARRTGGG